MLTRSVKRHTIDKTVKGYYKTSKEIKSIKLKYWEIATI